MSMLIKNKDNNTKLLKIAPIPDVRITNIQMEPTKPKSVQSVDLIATIINSGTSDTPEGGDVVAGFHVNGNYLGAFTKTYPKFSMVLAKATFRNSSLASASSFIESKNNWSAGLKFVPKHSFSCSINFDSSIFSFWSTPVPTSLGPSISAPALFSSSIVP